MGKEEVIMKYLFKTIILSVWLSVFLYGDYSGQINGYVYDAATHMPLAGANIILLDTEQGAAVDERGYFMVYNIQAGTYSIEASILGYRPQVKTSVVIEPGKTTQLLFFLEESSIEIEGLVVRADYFTKVKDAPVSERNFSSEEIQVQPGGIGDISRVVQAMPAVVSTGDQDNEIIVRGGSPNENLFLIDGIELPYPNHLNQQGEQGGGINILNALIIREIDFIAGAFPACYGDRSSSVMDISLKRGPVDKPGMNIDMSMAGLGMVAEIPLPGSGSFIASIHRSYLDFLVEADLIEMDIIPRYNSYFGKIVYDLSHEDEISLLAIYADDHVKAEPGTGIFDEDYAYDFNTGRAAFGIGWQRLYGDMGFGRFLISGAYTHWNGYEQEVNDNILGDTIGQQTATEEKFKMQYDGTIRWSSRQKTRFGVSDSWLPFSYMVYSAPDTIFTYTYDEDSTVIDSTWYLDANGDPVVSKAVDIDHNAASYKVAGYVQHRISLDQVGHITLGIRADYFRYTGHYDISPRLGFSSRPLFTDLCITAGYGLHYQSPPFHILLWDSTANQNLASRRSDHYIIGIEKLFSDDAKLTIEAYYKDIRNHHIPAHWTTSDPYDYSAAYLDTGKGYARGIEFFLQKKLSRNWHGTLSYSFSQARMAHPQDTTRTIPSEYDYGHVFTALGAYSIEFHQFPWYRSMPVWIKYTIGMLLFSDEADIGFRFRFMGGRPYTPMEWFPETRRWVENGDLLNSARLNDYQRLDIRWDHKYLFHKWSLAWYIEVQNVLDRKNLWWYNYKNDGTIEDIDQFRLFPVAGIVIEF
jgi:hypothetical protein